MYAKPDKLIVIIISQVFYNDSYIVSKSCKLYSQIYDLDKKNAWCSFVFGRLLYESDLKLEK